MRISNLRRFSPLRLSQVIPLGVAALLVLVLGGAAISYFVISGTRDRVQNLAQSDYGMLISTLEMKVSVAAMTNSTLDFLAQPEPVLREQVLKRIADFDAHLARYRQAAQSSRKHLLHAAKLGDQFKQYEASSLALLDRRAETDRLLSSIHRSFRTVQQRIDAEVAGNADLRNFNRPERLQLARQLEADSAQILTNLSEFLRTQSAPAREGIYGKITSFNTNLALFERTRAAYERRDWIGDIKQHFGSGVRNIQGLLELDVVTQAQRSEKARLRKVVDDLIDESVQILAVRSLDTAADGLMRTLNQITYTATALALLLMMILAAAFAYARMHVVLPVRKLHSALATVQQTGNLDVRTEAAGAPELREISGQVNQMLRQLSATTVSKLELEASQKQLEREVAERKSAQEALYESNLRLSDLVVQDELTGLPNRRGLADGISRAVAHAKRTRTRFAVLFVDLDHFKEVNDTKGHDVGDDLLLAVSIRLRQCVREEDMVARMGGDEFVALLTEIDLREDAAILAQKILNEASTPVRTGEFDLFWQASIGISTYPDDGQDATALLKAADTALYRAKEDGRNRFHYYSEDLTINATRRVEVADELRKALDNGDFFLQFQPQRAVADGTLVGVEALLRWRHPHWGMVLPDEFIPIAETTGLIVPLGEWVLREACKQAHAWAAAGLALRMSVNLSVRELSGNHIVDVVKESVAGLEPGLIEIEITESLIMRNLDAAVVILRQLRSAGVTVAMDDFGMGHSSLSRIKHLPLNRIKIDKSFVRSITDANSDSAALVRALIALSRALRLDVIAEGVENTRQLEFLKSEGCGEYQGYWGGQPMSAEEIERLIAPLKAARGGAPVLSVVPRFPDSGTGA